MPNVSLNDAPFCVLFTDCQLHTSSFFPFLLAPPPRPYLLQPHCCCLFAVCDACVAHTPRVTGISPCDLALFVCKLAGKGQDRGKQGCGGGGVAWKTFVVTDRELRERGSGSVRVLSLHLHLPASSLVSLIVVVAAVVVVVVVLVVAAVTCCHLLLVRCC